MKTAIELITDERERQISVKGWTPEHDDKEHADGQLASAAAHLIEDDFGEVEVKSITWDEQEWIRNLVRKPRSYKRRLVIAAAMLAAEVDRLQRLEPDNEG